MAQKSRNNKLNQVNERKKVKATSVEDHLAAEEPLKMCAEKLSPGITLRSLTLSSKLKL